MRRIPRRVRHGLLLRSFTVQGSWNYETLLGTGFAFTLVPALRFLYAGDPEGLRAALVRHADVFNSHPYLATVALGAVTRLEAEGVDPRMVERFKSALRGPLGSIGDQLVWSAWRPASLLLGLVLLLAGAAWWTTLATFLVAYNGLHLGLRWWGLKIGIEAGLDVGRVLREAPLQNLAKRASDAGALLCGLAVALAVAPTHPDPLQSAAAVLAMILGLILGLTTRRVMGALLSLAWLLAIISGLIS